MIDDVGVTSDLAIETSCIMHKGRKRLLKIVGI